MGWGKCVGIIKSDKIYAIKIVTLLIQSAREFSAILFQCVAKCVAKTKKVTFRNSLKATYINWLRELDLNQRPSGYEPDELPDCSIPRY